MLPNTKPWFWLALVLAGAIAFGCQTPAMPPVSTPTPLSAETTPPAIHSLPHTPTPNPPLPTWTDVATWAYQLTDYPDDRLDEIAASGYDLVVIDLARDGGEDFFARDEIAAVQSSGKIVLAYFEIGAIENYRPEWNTTPDALKLSVVEGWEDEQLVRYWDPRWWPIVHGRIDRALTSGFDGIYLDMVVAYEEIPEADTDLDADACAREMVALLVKISEYAKTHNAAFKIVPQNAPELHTWSGYLTAIDGLGMEELYFQATDDPCNEDWCAENRKAATAIRNAGKLVLTVDYADAPKNVEAAHAQARADGFIPYVTTVDLDRLQPH